MALLFYFSHTAMRKHLIMAPLGHEGDSGGSKKLVMPDPDPASRMMRRAHRKRKLFSAPLLCVPKEAVPPKKGTRVSRPATGGIPSPGFENQPLKKYIVAALHGHNLFGGPRFCASAKFCHAEALHK